MISRSTSFVSDEILSDQTGRGENITGSSICIWMVDDNDNFRSLLAELLAYEEDFVCSRQFPSAEAVLEALEHDTPPDVILLDIQMRGKSGLDAVGPIKTLASSTTVLMLTTFYDSHAKARAIRDGATDLLLKSYTVDEIAHRIRQAHYHRAADSVKPLENQSAGSVSEQSENDERVPSAPQNNCQNRSWRYASNKLARGVSYLRMLLMNGRGSRESAEVPNPIGSGREINCISE